MLDRSFPIFGRAATAQEQRVPLTIRSGVPHEPRLEGFIIHRRFSELLYEVKTLLNQLQPLQRIRLRGGPLFHVIDPPGDGLPTTPLRHIQRRKIPFTVADSRLPAPEQLVFFTHLCHRNPR
jgi:hypothetical protein